MGINIKNLIEDYNKEQENSEQSSSFKVKINDVEYEVHVKFYLPYRDRVQLVQDLVNYVFDDKYINAVKKDYYWIILFVKYYTDIEISDEDIENVNYEMVDVIVNTDIYKSILEHVDEKQISDLQSLIYETLDDIEKYNSSARGIMESISKDYSQVKFDADAIAKELGDSANFDLVRETLAKLS